jgi:hypothetical protein
MKPTKLTFRDLYVFYAKRVGLRVFKGTSFLVLGWLEVSPELKI